MSKNKRPAPTQATLRSAFDVALDGPTGKIIRRAIWLEALRSQFQTVLGLPLAQHCFLANLKGKQLVFQVDSAIWRTRLRMIEPDLRQAASAMTLKVTHIHAYICPTHDNPRLSWRTTLSDLNGTKINRRGAIAIANALSDSENEVIKADKT